MPPICINQHWDRLTDAQLLDCELTTDHPELLEGLVNVIPDGPVEPHVEYDYNFKGSNRTELVCAHCHAGHLRGYVVRKGDSRFLVGWKCGFTIYGEKFNRLQADYRAAVNKQAVLRQRGVILAELDPFICWLSGVREGKVIESYIALRRRLAENLPWIWEWAPHAFYSRWLPEDIDLPLDFMETGESVETDFAKIESEARALKVTIESQQSAEDDLPIKFRRVLDGLIARAERFVTRLEEAEEFFQPKILVPLCDMANEQDNPKKRRYTPGMMEITCKTERTRQTVAFPRSFRVPDTAPLTAIREALRKSYTQK